MANKRATGKAILRQIEQLDPVADDREIMHLAFEVLYGSVKFVHANFLLAFARQAAVPSIANVLYRNGHGDIVVDPQKRNDSTMTFFGEFVRLGHDTPEGIAAIEAMERIHDRFPITDEEKLYTLAVIMFDTPRQVAYMGARPYAPAINEASWHFWMGVASRMSLGDTGKTPEEIREWMLDFEQRTYAPTKAGHAIAQALLEDWTRWFPKPLKEWSKSMMYGVWDDHLRATLGVPDPPYWATKFMRFQAQQLLITAPYRILPLERTWSAQWSKRFGPGFDLSEVGNKPPAQHPATTPTNGTTLRADQIAR